MISPTEGGDEAPAVPPEVYDETYYRTACGGFAEWVESHGTGEAGIYAAALDRAGLKPGMSICDVGAGRGELVALAAQRGATRAIGIEYAAAAAKLSRQTISGRAVSGSALVVLADARRLPLPDRSVDLVFMLDIIEHLAPRELLASLREANRILRPGGRLFAHTFPTRTIYSVTYRGMRMMWRLRGARWPADPRNDYEHQMHVNEQTRRGLRRALKQAGFESPEVAHGQWIYTDFIPSSVGRRVVSRLGSVRLTAPLARADLWVNAVR